MSALIHKEEVMDYIIDVSDDGAFDKIATEFNLDSERALELEDLLYAYLKGEIELEQLPEFIAKAFGKSASESQKIAARIAEARLLSLESFIPHIKEVVTEWGGNADQTVETIDRQDLKPESIALRVLTERGIELPEKLKNRYLFLSEQLLSGKQDQEWFEAFAERDVLIGGLQINTEAAKNLAEALIAERKEVYTEVGIADQLEPAETATKQQEPVKALTQEEEKSLLDELNRQLKELHEQQVEQLRSKQPTKEISALPNPQVKEVRRNLTMDELSVLEEQLDSIDLGEDDQAALKKKIATMPIKIDGDLISEEEKAEVQQHAQARRPKVELTAEQEKELDVLWPVFKKKRISRIAMFDFAKTYLVGMRSERQMEGLMRDRYGLDQEAIDHAMDILMKVKVTMEQSQLQERKDNLPDLAGIQAMEEEVLSKRYAVMTKKANVMSGSTPADSSTARVSASRSKEEELALQAKRISEDKLNEAIIASKPKPVAPKLSKPSTPPSETRHKITDINYQPALIGPVDELGTMTVEDFKRMATSPEEAVNKLLDKIEELSEIAESKRIEGILAWRKSPVYKVYRSMMQESLSTGTALSEIASNRRNKGDETLTPAEIKALIKANKMLQF